MFCLNPAIFRDVPKTVTGKTQGSQDLTGRKALNDGIERVDKLKQALQRSDITPLKATSLQESLAEETRTVSALRKEDLVLRWTALQKDLAKMRSDLQNLEESATECGAFPAPHLDVQKLTEETPSGSLREKEESESWAVVSDPRLQQRTEPNESINERIHLLKAGIVKGERELQFIHAALQLSADQLVLPHDDVDVHAKRKQIEGITAQINHLEGRGSDPSAQLQVVKLQNELQVLEMELKELERKIPRASW